MRYIDTRPNGDALRKCILQGPYKLSTVVIPAQPAINDSPAVPEHITEFGKFTSHDGESMESYYSRFYKMMNEMIRNNLEVATMQYQKEVNESHAAKIAKNANLLALVTATQQYPEPYYQAPISHKSYRPPLKQSSFTRSHAPARYKGKEIAKPITPPSKSASEEDRDPEQAQKDKEMQRNLALIAKKPKRAKDYTYHKEKMLLCKQAEKGVPLQAEQADRLDDTDEEIDEKELEAHYNYMAKIQEVPTADSETDIEPLEKELNECKITLEKTNRTREESNSIRDICLIAFQNKEIELEKYKAYNDRTLEYDKLERKLNETLGLLAQKEQDMKEGLKLKAYEISIVKEKHDELVK
ncbi:hypothetical protein Tco_0015400 [Tanacetum coccineum]